MGMFKINDVGCSQCEWETLRLIYSFGETLKSAFATVDLFCRWFASLLFPFICCGWLTSLIYYTRYKVFISSEILLLRECFGETVNNNQVKLTVYLRKLSRIIVTGIIFRFVAETFRTTCLGKIFVSRSRSDIFRRSTFLVWRRPTTAS